MCHDFRARCFVNVVQRNQSSPRRPAVRNKNTNREKKKKTGNMRPGSVEVNFFPASLRRRNRSERVFPLKQRKRGMHVGRGYQRRNEMNAPLSAETDKALCCVRHGRCSCCCTKQRKIINALFEKAGKPARHASSISVKPPRTKWVSDRSGRRRKSTQSMMFMQCRPTPIRSTMGSMSKAVQRVRTASKAMSKNKIKTEYQRDLRNA
jgi:hypothetical protein